MKKQNPPAKTAPAPKKEATASTEKPKKAFQLVRGMHDRLPKEEKYWKKMYRATENVADYFQFGRIDTPVLEEANLYVRSVGKGTDIVDKEMYVFEDRDGSKLALRPEGSAGVVRAFISNGMWNMPQPVKVWYLESMFRHDRPQAGRYREHHQVGFENFGVKDPAIDAELIIAAYSIFHDMELPVEIRLNCVGTPQERARYVEELTSYYRAKRSYLCEDCRVRLTKNPLRLLDCKSEQCQPIRDEAPQILDWLEEDSKKYFMKILEFLDDVGVTYTMSPYLVRGLDYYTGMVFEIYPVMDAPAHVSADVSAEALSTGQAGSAKVETSAKTETQQSAIGGGGRYDLLVEELGGRPTPVVGFGIGVERVVAALADYQKKHNLIEPDRKYDVYFAQLGDEAKRLGLKMLMEMRNKGLAIAFNLAKGSLKAQLETANTLKVPYVVILGQKEVQDETVIIRDMESGVQEIVGHKKLEAALKKKLGRV